MRGLQIFLVLLLLLTATGAAHTFYLDPQDGDLQNDGSISAPFPGLSDVIGAQYIQSYRYSPLPYDPATSTLVPKHSGARIHPGDTLVLLSGLHGAIFLQNYYNDVPIVVMAGDNETPILRNLRIQAGNNWVFSGLTVSSEPYGSYDGGQLINLESHGWQGPVSNITIEDCYIYSAVNPWSTAQDWLDNVSSGIMMKGDSITVVNNYVTNIDMGIQAVGDYCVVAHNVVRNFSGDGMRILGSNCLFVGNYITNCYKVDDNHDDGIQSFNIDTYIVDNNIVRGNTILNFEDPNQPLSGPLQGIGCFDGYYNNWVVENNLIVVDHWHGISFYGANNCVIRNNTVLDPNPGTSPGPSWIRITDKKTGEHSNGCTVVNNVVNQLDVDGSTSHNVILKTLNEYAAQFVDHTSYDFHLRPTSILIDSADTDAASAIDKDGISRPVGPRADVGCYEYHDGTTGWSNLPTPEIYAYPNPVQDALYMTRSTGVRSSFAVYDVLGNKVAGGSVEGESVRIELPKLRRGMYFIRLDGISYKFIKQ